MSYARLSTLFLLLVAAPLVAQDTTSPGTQDTTSLSTPDATSQTPPGIPSRLAFPIVAASSREDNYLRYLQSVGQVRPYPWSIRGFAPRETPVSVSQSRLHPHYPGLATIDRSRFSARILPIEVALRFNSAFPFGSNDGPIWAGRGFTPSITGGVVAEAGPVSLVLAPIAFLAENRNFELMPTGQSGVAIFRNGLWVANIDLPQRFGDNSYGRIDWGASTLRADLLGVTAGVSTANLSWGPMQTFNYVLGNNAPGFAHVFAGTGRPVNVGLAHLHLRAIWGRLEQSDYSPVGGSSYYSSTIESGTRRFASGLIAVIQPRGMPGLEIGGARFFHSLWPRGGIPRSYITKPLQAFQKKNIPESPGLVDARGGQDNQEASAFARWVFPGNGFEVYGEYGREDHNWHKRDFVQEPDHSRSYGLGFRKVIASDSARLSAVRVESINYQLPTLGRNRSEGGIYAHGVIRQGHTNNGQPLGADTGVGTGAGFVLAWDRFSQTGRSSWILTRTLRQEMGTFYTNGAENPRSSDVQIGIGAERVRYVSKLEVGTTANLIHERNRDFRSNVWNLNAMISLRYHGER